ncbi:MAG: chaperone modulator CbpM [Steroidobacteraceae bacterium]
MSSAEHPALTGTLLEERDDFTLDELTQFCAVERSRIVELVDEGVLEVGTTTEWRFNGATLHRARVALRLQRDLGLNAPGTALVLDLLERIDALERRIGRR